ncbi:unnamed protein product [Effrenium voratum]|nr:unnamed protein product [Effrenium voratum]
MGNNFCACEAVTEDPPVRTDPVPVVEDLPMEFPMWLIPAKVLVTLRPPLKPHKDMVEAGHLIQWRRGHPNKVMLISHQWAGTRHPDPKFEQFLVLQEAFLQMSQGNCRVSKDPSSELSELNGRRTPVMSIEDQKACLDWDVWYDYFGCPQIDDDRAYDNGAKELQAAVNSIPSYCTVADCVFVLAPTMRHSDSGRMMSRSTWGMRGWCRAERTAFVLSQREGQLMFISSPTSILVSNGNEWARAWPGEGHFTVEADREKVKQLTKDLLLIKCHSLWLRRNMPGWRFYQALHPRAQGHPPMQEEESLEDFLQRYNLDTTLHHLDQGGLSPLMLASIEGNLSVIQKLVESQANVNEFMSWDIKDAQLEGQHTALSLAAALSNRPTVKLLLSLSADMHLPMDRLGSNAVMTAARFGNHEVVPLLIAGPSDLLRQNFFGGRALHVASISENPQVTRTLLQMHSDPNVATNIGCPVLCFSPQYGTDPGHIEYLLKARADPNFSGQPVGSGVDLSKTWMKKVRENSASLAEINLALGNGGTPLHFAALNGALEIAQMLVQYKANPKAAWGEQSRTPLQLAQEQGHASLVKLLEEIG